MMRLMISVVLMTLAGSCLALDTQMPPLADEIGCTKCHAIDHKVVGPAWIVISKHYREKRDDPATFDALVKKVSRGGAGNWGDVPMAANDPIGKRQDKIQSLVKFVLSLSDQLPEYQAKK